MTSLLFEVTKETTGARSAMAERSLVAPRLSVEDPTRSLPFHDLPNDLKEDEDRILIISGELKLKM